MSKYFISCFSGAKNMGDEFILKCIVKLIKDYDANSHITVSSLDPDYTIKSIKDVSATEWHGIGLTKKSFKNLGSLITSIKNVDYVLIGGGGLLQDVHSVATIPRYLITAVIAKYFNKKVIYYSLGIGPIKNKLLNKLVKDISNKFVDYITVRDEASKVYLTEMGVKTSIRVTSDPVFSVSEFIPTIKSENSNTEVGICFRQFKTNQNVEREIERLIEKLLEQEKTIYLFPLDIEEDKHLCSRLKEKFHGLVVIDQYKSLEDLIMPLSQIDFMISMRLHGVITCASYGIPSIAISYDPKVANIQEKIGMRDYLINIEDFNSSLCIEKFNQLESEYKKIDYSFNTQIKKEIDILNASIRESIEHVESNSKKVSKIQSLRYLFKVFYPQVIKKLKEWTKS